jgi:protein-S-isoprenylcysteine O-methyltransferase Ste14
MRSHRIFAAAGGLLFAASLVFFLARYLGGWGPDVSGPCSTLTAAWRPILIDIALFTLFAAHHSLFARTGVKAWITSRVPPALERATYVWIASLLFLATCAWWQPVPGVLWHTDQTSLALAAQAAGIVFSVQAAGRLDALELAGFRQVLGDASHIRTLDRRGPYAFVRHPIYFGWLLIVWPAATMTGTRLVFAAVSTLYLALAIPFEERDLRRTFGTAYDDYCKQVRWRMLPYVY